MTPRLSTKLCVLRKTVQAFSLIELLVAVSLMSVIVFGLYSMFSETQKALRTNISQVDVLETGRAAVEILAQDIQQAAASGLLISASATNGVHSHLNSIPPAPNFFSGIQNNTMPVVQNLADGTKRTNIIQEAFFLTRSNLNWMAKGFFVSPSPTNAVVADAPETIAYGTLFRFASPNVHFDAGNPDLDRTFEPTRRINWKGLDNFWNVYQRAKMESHFFVADTDKRQPRKLTSALIDGVIHFKLQPVDSLGRPMRYWTNNPIQESRNRSYPSVILARDVVQMREVVETQSLFYGNALPAYVELEIGVMDPLMLERARSMGNSALAREFLNREPGGVHLFRRMIPLRTAPKIIPSTTKQIH